MTEIIVDMMMIVPPRLVEKYMSKLYVVYNTAAISHGSISWPLSETALWGCFSNIFSIFYYFFCWRMADTTERNRFKVAVCTHTHTKWSVIKMPFFFLWSHSFRWRDPFVNDDDILYATQSDAGKRSYFHSQKQKKKEKYFTQYPSYFEKGCAHPAPCCTWCFSIPNSGGGVMDFFFWVQRLVRAAV